jgi:acyl carrier protein
MGLDLVELVMQTEETFAFTIPNEEAGQVQTVGDLYRLEAVMNFTPLFWQGFAA